jgi:hypothetical protein
MFGLLTGYMDFLDGAVFADIYTPLGTDNSGNPIFLTVGFLNPEGTNISGWLGQSQFYHQLTWDFEAGTLSYPATVDVAGYGPLTAVWGIMGRNASGEVVSRVSNVYSGLVLAPDGSDGARVGGTRLDLGDDVLPNVPTFSARRDDIHSPAGF